jgi:Fe-Mn family superoxide dismutase
MPDIPRRPLAAGAGLLVGAMALQAGAQQQIATAATTPKFRALPLTFSADKIKWLSEKLLTSHHDNNYGGAVKRLNAISDERAKRDFANSPSFMLNLSDPCEPPSAEPAFTMNGLKREEHVAYNSTILHELYFECLGEAPTQPSGVFAQALARDFGSLDRWKAEFAATGKALGGGSGWVILAYAPRDKRLFTHWAADHSMAPAGGVPLLALDMYEHAYQMDYGADAGKYVDNFMQSIRGTTPERLYREAIRV